MAKANRTVRSVANDLKVSESKSHPLVGSVGEVNQEHLAMFLVERLNDIVNGPVRAAPSERDWDHAVGNIAQGTREIGGQLEIFNDELRTLEQILRPHMPDHLYEEKDGEGCVANEGYFPASSCSNTPAIAALCEIANKIQSLRRYLNYITTNVVV